MNKSKELCELLGIEPSFIAKSKLTGHINYNDYRTLKHCEEYNLEAISQPYYPDFRKPSNFVKLLKLRPYNSSPKCIGWRSNYTFVDQNCELNLINELLDSLKNDIFAELQFIKQQCQQTEWEY